MGSLTSIGQLKVSVVKALVLSAVVFSWGCGDSSVIQEQAVVSEAASQEDVAVEVATDATEAPVVEGAVENEVAENLPLVLQLGQSGSVELLGADGLPKSSIESAAPVSAVIANTRTITLLDLAESNQVMICTDGECKVYANESGPAS